MDDLDRWARLLASAAVEQATQPERICQLCVDMLDISGAGISVVTSAGNRGVVCATDERASFIENLQLTLGAGPCVDAVRSGAPVLIDDLAQQDGSELDGWSTFLTDAHSAGIGAVYAFPLRIGAIRIGALDLYRDVPGELGGTRLSAALLAADAAALALLHLDTGGSDVFADDVETRTTFHLQVHQATGMVAVQLGVGLSDALLLLRARAYADNRPIADVARDVVERRLRFTREDT